jgi:hypothetical protein
VRVPGNLGKPVNFNLHRREGGIVEAQTKPLAELLFREFNGGHFLAHI